MKWILYPLLSMLTLQNVLAWGPDGHKIVAKIAEDQLSPKAKAAVQKLLGGSSLPDVAIWADTIKGQTEWAHTKSWHFVDIPDETDYASIPHTADGDVITAITQNVADLKSASASVEDKKNALMFLVHFVGDMHQPLHVGRPDDRGGNSITIKFDNKSTNLHALWDSGLIKQKGVDYETYARELEKQKAFDTAPYDIAEFQFSAVIAEDMALRAQIYQFHAVSDGPIVLDAGYLKRNVASLESRLLLGGNRLAGILNSVYK
jgi:hypothetical protein